MQIAKMNGTNIFDAHALFNSIAGVETVHKQLDEAQFEAQFVSSDENIQKISRLMLDGDRVVGFANGCYKASANAGYITFIAVEKSYRRKGVAKTLLKELETELYSISNNSLEKYQITFFNPINLEWCIPNTEGHDHPNAPGVDVACEGYIFLKNVGYRDTAYQNSFYQPLRGFELSSKIKERLDELKKQDITITYYDSSKHFGLQELFDDLGNEQWREIIIGNVEKPDGYPVLIAEHQGKAIGFTGPLYVQPSGRGYFAGIGVHSEYRKYGLGKALFSSLCISLKEMGAEFMTLFTGETNPARNIYESAGFKIVRSWTDMEKEIK